MSNPERMIAAAEEGEAVASRIRVKPSLVCEYDGKKFPHLGVSLAPGAPTKWFCNETCKRKWQKAQAKDVKPVVRVGV